MFSQLSSLKTWCFPAQISLIGDTNSARWLFFSLVSSVSASSCKMTCCDQTNRFNWYLGSLTTNTVHVLFSWFEFDELLDFTGILRMLFTGVMVMTTMATACGLSFPEVEGEVVGVVVAEQWDPRGEGMAPPPDVPRTGLLCQVSDEFLPLQVISLPTKCIDECMSLTPPFPLRPSSQWKLAGPEGSHARCRWGMLRWRVPWWHRVGGVCTQRGHDLRCP